VLVLLGLVGLGVSVQMLLPPAIVADLVLFDEQHSGHRREALVFGLQGCIEKNAVMLATLVVGLVMQLGNSADDPAGIYWVGPIAAVASLAGFGIFRLYPLGRGWRRSASDDPGAPAPSTGATI